MNPVGRPRGHDPAPKRARCPFCDSVLRVTSGGGQGVQKHVERCERESESARAFYRAKRRWPKSGGKMSEPKNVVVEVEARPESPALRCKGCGIDLAVQSHPPGSSCAHGFHPKPTVGDRPGNRPLAPLGCAEVHPTTKTVCLRDLDHAPPHESCISTW